MLYYLFNFYNQQIIYTYPDTNNMLYIILKSNRLILFFNNLIFNNFIFKNP